MAIDQAESEHDWDRNKLLDAKNVYKSNILDSVAKSNVFFRSQQRWEKDLTFEEKREIASDLLERNLKLFLQRYWKYINVKDTPYFDHVCDDYEIHFYLEEIRKFSNEKTRKAKIHNRRYQALKKMVREGSYFSFEEMQERNPLLFEQLVGQYLSQDKRAEIYGEKGPCTSFSSFLLESIDKKCVEEKMKEQEEQEASMEEESDSETEEVPCEKNNYIELPEEERQLLITEFTNMMYESFISGSDENFDYSSIDDNEEYDCVEEREVDEEEKYFDAD